MQCHFLERMAVNGVPAVIRRFNVPEELLNPVRLLDLPGIAAEPFIVQRNIGRYAVGIAEEMPEIAMGLEELQVCRRNLRIPGKGRLPDGRLDAGRLCLLPQPPSRMCGPARLPPGQTIRRNEADGRKDH